MQYENESYELDRKWPLLRRCIMVSCILLCMGSTLHSAETLHCDSISKTYIIYDKVTAYNRAIAYLGFDKLQVFSEKNLKNAALEIIKDCRTPFVAEQMKKNEVWKLNFTDVPVQWHSGEVKRDFEVILDPLTGQLLSVYSLSDKEGSSDTLPEPKASIAEKDLKERLILFDSLPAILPMTTLVDALEKCIMNPAKAKIIRAFYIEYHTRTISHKGSWIIILRGTEFPMEPFGRWGSVPVNERNSLLYSIDSETGLLEFVMNAPQDIDLIRRMKGIIKEE